MVLKIRFNSFQGKYLTSVDLEDFTCPNSDTIIESNDELTITKPTSISSTLSSLMTTPESQTSTERTLKYSKKIDPNSHLLMPLSSDNFSTISQQKQQSQVIITTQHDFNYYSLIVGISLSISFICLLILIIFYLFCIKNHQNDEKTSGKINYFNDFLNSSKYDVKFCSPPLSSSSCSSSSSTSSSIAYSKNSKSLDLSSDIFQTSYLNTNCDLGRKHVAPAALTLCSHCDTSTTFLSNSNNPYNHLNNSIFSINLQQQQHQASLNNETHIYHEINTPSKETSQTNVNKKFLYENNLNYLVVPPLAPEPTQFSSFNSNNANVKNLIFKQEFLNVNDQNRLVNDFSNSLFV